MKKTQKVLALVLCAVLLVAGSVMGTLAYLTSQDQVVNTFTVGDVKIKLDEAVVDTADPNDRTEKGNQYHLVPGKTYTKDPTVWVEEGSEPSYIRMKVTISNYNELVDIFGDPFLPQNYVGGWDPATWVTTNEIVVDTDKNEATYEFRYKDIYTATADNKDGDVDYDMLPALFTTINFPGESVNNAQLATLEGLQIKVVAHAIQAATFANADAAWAAFAK